MNEVQKLSKVFENLGAQSTQALTMARQVMRRADQLAEEKNISRIDSLGTPHAALRAGFSR